VQEDFDPWKLNQKSTIATFCFRKEMPASGWGCLSRDLLGDRGCDRREPILLKSVTSCKSCTCVLANFVFHRHIEMLSRSLLRTAASRAVKSIPQRSTGIVAGARARSLHSTGSRRNAETVQTPTTEEKGFEAHFGE
jgi:hypothetical protein